MNMHGSWRKPYGVAVFSILLASVLIPLAVDAAEPIVMNQPDIASWQDVEGVRALSPTRRAKEAVLWGDPKTGEHGLLNEWGPSVRSGWHTRARDTRIVVVRGTFAVSIEGQRARELDAGGFMVVPQGVKQDFGCTGMGRCTFVLYHNGPAGVQAAQPPGR